MIEHRAVQRKARWVRIAVGRRLGASENRARASAAGGESRGGEGAALPSGIPGVAYSDHWSFWETGYPAVMVTDTSYFRNPHYHTGGDTPGTLDYERMARVVDALESVLGAELGAD